MKKKLSPEQQARSAERKAKLAGIIEQIAAMPPNEKAALAATVEVANVEGRTLSPRNQLLIALQLGSHCTIVGGFRQWIKNGRCVRKGESGAMILFPRTFGDNATPNESTDSASETAAHAANGKGNTRFYSGTVFDISQTEELKDKAADANEESPRVQWEPGDETRTIWDSDGTAEPVLICAPPPGWQETGKAIIAHARHSIMNRPPPGGWTDADKVPQKDRKPTPNEQAEPIEIEARTITPANPEEFLLL